MAVRGMLKHAWNAFLNQPRVDAVRASTFGVSYGGGVRPDRLRLNLTNERTIVASIYTRIGIDVAATSMRHVRLDENDRYLEEIDSGLNNCLKVEANLDQGASAFKLDIILSLLEAGCIAVVPVDTDLSPLDTGGFDIKTLRVGPIVQWFPEHVRVSLYNDKSGRREELTLPKRTVAIIENPFYTVMNEPNSTLQRLIRKLNLLDSVDEATSSGKLDIIIQLPYVVKSETKKQQAEQRRTDIEYQLKGSKYGIAYIDGTEKITQLNRPADNNMLAQIVELKKQVYLELGLDEEIMSGKANAEAVLGYNNNTIEPLVRAITEELHRKFLTKTARSQRQAIWSYRDPFRLVPVKDLAEIADKFTRNTILTSNEIRGIVGFKPSNEPNADKLINSNLYNPDGSTVAADPNASVTDTSSSDASINASLDAMNQQIEELLVEAGA